MAGFRHLGDEPIVDLHRVRVVRATFEAPDGTRFERDVIRDKRVVAMVPIDDDGRSALLVRQYRGPIDAELLEIPAGLCDVEGEDDPLVTAQRELAEEVGKRAAQLELLAEIHQSPGISDEHALIYLATGLSDVDHDPQGPEEEHMTIERVLLDDVPGLVADRTLTDAKTIVGLLLARERLRSTPAS
ncbi:MAG: nudF [Acidimicrobiales bacterium]|nr:nudF [Acidimicrobiales bacterium]